MNLLSDEQLEFQRLAADFVAHEITPKAAAFDREQTMPIELIKQMGDLGLMNVRIPEAFGGLGLKTIDACIIASQLALGCSGVAGVGEASELAATPLLLFGSAPQCAQLLRPLATSSKLAGLSVTDYRESGLRAKQSEDGFILSGIIPGVINAHVADWYFLSTPSSNEKEENIFFLPSDVPGVEILPTKSLLGKRAADIASIHCHEVKLASQYSLSVPGSMSAFENKLAMHNFPIIAAGCIGIGQAALNKAVAYAKERSTFGKPIAQHQAVSFMLADMARMIEVAKILTFKAALACDRNLDEPALYFSAKAYAQDMVMSVTTDAVQILGAYGYTKEYAVEKLMRDAKMAQLFYGSSEAIKVKVGEALLAE